MQAYQQRPANRDVLSALVTYLQERGDPRAALRYAEQLLTLVPENHEIQGLVEALQQQAVSP